MSMLRSHPGKAQTLKHDRTQALWSYGVPLVICLALMAPRILSAQFNFHDDPTSIAVSRQVLAGDWAWGADRVEGRFRPLYWLYSAGLYGLAGPHAGVYFVANAGLLCAITGMLSTLVYRLTRSRLQAGAAGVFFALSGPVVENVYTLSKPELLQATFFALFALCGVLASEVGRGRVRLVWLVSATVASCLSMLAKETGLLLVPVSLVWLAVACAISWSARKRASTALSFGWITVVASVVGLLGYILQLQILGPPVLTLPHEGARFLFNADRLLANVMAWGDWANRDFLYLVPLVIFPTACMLRREAGRGEALILFGGVWMVAWFGLYLPWEFVREYYLLPASMSAAVIGAAGMGRLRHEWQSTSPARRWIALALMGIALLVALLTIPGNISNARIQLAVDSANAELVEYMRGHAAEGSLVAMNIQIGGEYVKHFGSVLTDLEGRGDVTVEAFQFRHVRPPTVEGSTYLIASPIVENVPYLSVRMGVNEFAAREWESSLLEFHGKDALKVYEVRREFDLLVIDSPRLICLLLRQLPYCQAPNAPFDTRRFLYGWRIYLAPWDEISMVPAIP